MTDMNEPEPAVEAKPTAALTFVRGRGWWDVP
jgi:hypothetical protein